MLLILTQDSEPIRYVLRLLFLQILSKLIKTIPFNELGMTHYLVYPLGHLLHVSVIDLL